MRPENLIHNMWSCHQTTSALALRDACGHRIRTKWAIIQIPDLQTGYASMNRRCLAFERSIAIFDPGPDRWGDSVLVERRSWSVTISIEVLAETIDGFFLQLAQNHSIFYKFPIRRQKHRLKLVRFYPKNKHCPFRRTKVNENPMLSLPIWPLTAVGFCTLLTRIRHSVVFWQRNNQYNVL